MKRASVRPRWIIFNEVETKDLCTVRYSSTSNKDLLFCSFEVLPMASRPSYLDRLWSYPTVSNNSPDSTASLVLKLKFVCFRTTVSWLYGCGTQKKYEDTYKIIPCNYVRVNYAKRSSFEF